MATAASRPLAELREQVVGDRLALARQVLTAGEKLYSARPRQNRSAISRYYYVMYHAARALVFYDCGGDDHEAHSVLPTKMPFDFPSRDYWANELKSARENRNSADYDPYPVDGRTWRSIATDLHVEAPQLLAAVGSYLRTKGCRYL